MFTKRLALSGLLYLLIFASACGPSAGKTEPVATEAPLYSAPATEPPVMEMLAQENYLPALPTMGAAPNSRDREPYDMFFEDYGVNPSIDAEDDNLSSFALDVDTGSYTIMRNYLSEGNLPPADSVRVEEYVNYFEQDYPIPSEHQAFTISVDGAPSPFTLTERYQMIRVGIQGYQVPNSERKDANLVFVIDVSGSMDLDNRLGLVKRSLELLVEQLRRTDTVSIVVYGTNARLILEPTPGSAKGEILRAINHLQPEGVTNAEAGIRLGYRTAMRAYIPDGINRIILCSDGVANMGQIESDEILAEVRGYVEEGVTLATFGFGMDNYNDTLMEQLADNGDGTYAYIDDMEEARRLFIDKLTSTLQTIAMDAKVQVEFNPEVVMRYRLVGFENRAIADDDFRDNRVDAGEIGAGHSVTALYEVKLHPETFGRIATVYLRWQDPDLRQVVEMSKDLTTEDMAYRFEDSSPYFQRAVVVAEYAEILKQSYWAEENTLSDVYREAQRVAELLFRDKAMQEFVELIHKALRLWD
ncbi:MAG: VWA domain-containing protein [Anaerolineaceae bacterium]|nr:VWA domain-containing protein [Anaerolineaceae bacterium]